MRRLAAGSLAMIAFVHWRWLGVGAAGIFAVAFLAGAIWQATPRRRA